MLHACVVAGISLASVGHRSALSHGATATPFHLVSCGRRQVSSRICFPGVPPLLAVAHSWSHSCHGLRCQWPHGRSLQARVVTGGDRTAEHWSFVTTASLWFTQSTERADMPLSHLASHALHSPTRYEGQAWALQSAVVVGLAPPQFLSSMVLPAASSHVTSRVCSPKPHLFVHELHMAICHTPEQFKHSSHALTSQ